MFAFRTLILSTLFIAEIVDCFKVTKIESSNIYPIEGESVRLSCTSDTDFEYCDWKHSGNVCKFEWKRKHGGVLKQDCHNSMSSIQFSGNYGKHECAITIPVAMMADTGRWTCDMEEYKFGIVRGYTHKRAIIINVMELTTTTATTEETTEEISEEPTTVQPEIETIYTTVTTSTTSSTTTTVTTSTTSSTTTTVTTSTTSSTTTTASPTSTTTTAITITSTTTSTAAYSTLSTASSTTSNSVATKQPIIITTTSTTTTTVVYTTTTPSLLSTTTTTLIETHPELPETTTSKSSSNISIPSIQSTTKPNFTSNQTDSEEMNNQNPNDDDMIIEKRTSELQISSAIDKTTDDSQGKLGGTSNHLMLVVAASLTFITILVIIVVILIRREKLKKVVWKHKASKSFDMDLNNGQEMTKFLNEEMGYIHDGINLEENPSIIIQNDGKLFRQVSLNFHP